MTSCVFHAKTRLQKLSFTFVWIVRYLLSVESLLLCVCAGMKSDCSDRLMRLNYYRWDRQTDRCVIYYRWDKQTDRLCELLQVRQTDRRTDRLCELLQVTDRQTDRLCELLLETVTGVNRGGATYQIRDDDSLSSSTFSHFTELQHI